jgi:glycosyltransferase involved in cell wall biosynthesis
VHYLGFVTREEYYALLKCSAGLVFPSMIGPTNLPPLEAQILGKPMSISDFHEINFDSKPSNCNFFDSTDINSIKEMIIEMLNFPDSEIRETEAENRKNMIRVVSAITDVLNNRRMLGLIRSS